MRNSKRTLFPATRFKGSLLAATCLATALASNLAFAGDKHAPAAQANPANSHGAAHAPFTPVPGEQALRWLQNGNKRFTSGKYRADGKASKDRQRLNGGQHPHAIVLSCADSRVPPEMVFDQSLGEIFTVRVAGQALDASVIASIEYAVEHLGPRLLVVMGHTKCGAVDAAMKIKAGESAGSESLDRLLANIRPHLPRRSPAGVSHELHVESAANADGVLKDLLARSPIIKKKVDSGELLVRPALYQMDTGKVDFH